MSRVNDAESKFSVVSKPFACATFHYAKGHPTQSELFQRIHLCVAFLRLVDVSSQLGL